MAGLVQALEGGQFHGPQHAVAQQDREGQQGRGRGGAQPGADLHVVLGGLGQEDLGALQHALADQALPGLQGLVEALAFLEGVAPHQPQLLVGLVVQIEDRVPHLQEGGQPGQEPPGQLVVGVGALQLGEDLVEAGLDPALLFGLPGSLLQHLDGAGQGADLVGVVGVRDLDVQVALGQILDRRLQPGQRVLDGGADQQAHPQAQGHAAQEQEDGELEARGGRLPGVDRRDPGGFLVQGAELGQGVPGLVGRVLEVGPAGEAGEIGAEPLALQFHGDGYELLVDGILLAELLQELLLFGLGGVLAQVLHRGLQRRLGLRQLLQGLLALGLVPGQGRLPQGAPHLHQVDLGVLGLGDAQEVDGIEGLDVPAQVVQVPEAVGPDDQGHRQEDGEAQAQLPRGPPVLQGLQDVQILTHPGSLPCGAGAGVARGCRIPLQGRGRWGLSPRRSSSPVGPS